MADQEYREAEEVKDTEAKTEAENIPEAEKACEAGTETPQEPEAPEEAPAGESETKEEKAGFFGKKKKADKEKQALIEKTAELEDRVRRQMAEFENFRKRNEKEKEQMFTMGERSVIEKILPVVDSFELGLQAIPEEEKESPVAQGMDKIYRQLIGQLEAMNVKPMECVGEDFDPNLHNAIMQVDSEEFESGKVAQVFQKGYMYKESVIRHSMVGVVK